MQEFAKKFYKSKQWRRCRESFLESKSWRCNRCYDNPASIAHHRIYLTPQNINDPNISLSWNNLEALCQNCHNEEHFGKKNQRYVVEADGKVHRPPSSKNAPSMGTGEG